MPESQLLIGCSRDPDPCFRQVARIPGFNFDTNGIRINQHKTITTVSGMHHQRSDTRNFQRHTKLIHKRRHIGDRNALSFTTMTRSTDLHQPPGRFQQQTCFRFGHGNNSGFQKHGGHAH